MPEYSLKAKNKNLKLYWLLPPFIVMLAVLFVYLKNGIFPFGTESIVYDDMGQCNVPIYYYLHDVLHGKGSLLFNFKTAFGVFICGAYESGLSIVNLLFFLICPRDYILESISFFLLIKLMTASFFSVILFDKIFTKMPKYWRICFSVLYAFNPYLLQYYSNISWVEVVMVFPLVILGLYTLFNERKCLLYILSLAYCLIVQLYISYMIVLFLFLSGGVYVVMMMKKEERKSAVFRFGMSSILALLLSAFSALPTFFYMTDSSRYENTKSYFQAIMSEASNPVTKLGMMIILTALPIALVVLLMFKIHKDPRRIAFFGIILAIFVIPVLFENINLLWHMGSYANFSMRYAFMFHLMLLITAGFFIENYGDTLYRSKKLSFAITTVISGLLILVSVANMLSFYENSGKGVISKKNFPLIICVFLIMVTVYALILKFGFKKVSYVAVTLLVAFESCFYLNRGLTTGSARAFEYSLDFIEECETINNTLTECDDNLARIKNIDGTLNSNYPLITGHPSLSNFTHTIPSSIKKTMQKMGYSTVYTRILDTGGTLFSDALLGYKYTLSLDTLNNGAYTFERKVGNYNLYKNEYTLPFGTVCSKDIVDKAIFGKLAFNTTNNIWKSVSGSDDDIVAFPDVQETVLDREVLYDFTVDGTKELYIVCTGSTKRKTLQIYLNGEKISVPSLGEEENTRYNTRFNNSFLHLGTFTDTDVNIRVELLTSNITTKKLKTYIALFDTALLSDYCEEARDTVRTEADDRSLKATATAKDDDSYLFLPVTYDEGWKCKVNGKAVDVETAVGTFVAVPLEKGENTVELSFIPKGFVLGIMISSVTVVLTALFILFEKKKMTAKTTNRALSVLTYAYITAVCGAYAVLYIVPMVCRFITLLT
ncbi:MAG: YfhO family protein [Clostridia bacterium]|nr:YfhO family protein [Clostridia bacterium]